MPKDVKGPRSLDVNGFRQLGTAVTVISPYCSLFSCCHSSYHVWLLVPLTLQLPTFYNLPFHKVQSERLQLHLTCSASRTPCCSVSCICIIGPSCLLSSFCFFELLLTPYKAYLCLMPTSGTLWEVCFCNG